MSGMLASVNCLAEALLALTAQVDIIDLKQPAQGALGALPVDEVRQIVAAINGRCPVSATIGDLPMHPETVAQAVTAMAATGVDYVKIGFFPGGDWLATLKQLDALNNNRSIRLIAVLFADNPPDFAVIAKLKEHGFTGVMLDTMDKQKGALTSVMSSEDIGRFVSKAKQLGLLCGLAGSLRLIDIAGLMRFQADYLGFRGALCMQHQRIARIDEQRLKAVREALNA